MQNEKITIDQLFDAIDETTATESNFQDGSFNLEKLLELVKMLPSGIVYKTSDYFYDKVQIKTRNFKSKKKRNLKKFKKLYTRTIRKPWENALKLNNPIDGKIYIIGAPETIAKLKASEQKIKTFDQRFNDDDWIDRIVESEFMFY